MAAVYGRDEISLEETGTAITVPNNDVARLMYYLSCVCSAIDCNHDPEIRRFIDYRNWASLSVDDQKALLVICYTFSPDVFNNRVFFHSDALCGSTSNNFYRINQVRDRLVVAESIVIAGRIREVNEIMTYTMQWMRTNYLEPMERLARRLTASVQPTTYRSTYTPSVVREPTSYSRSSGCSCRKVCCILCCVLIAIPVIVVIITIIVSAVRK